jgi:pimeloyl-ACP methyl ester carboxylesterase
VLALASWPACSAGSPALSPLTASLCPSNVPAGFQCATVTVPLDRGGQVPGTVTLKLERKQAGLTASKDAVIALAGGPGQAALPLSEFVAKAIAPALGARDLLVFDQRGTGASDPLSCPVFEVLSTQPAGEIFQQCASELGPARAAFTTQESVQDIEALREAGGYEKLVLYGTSFGTKVALEYAERYP